MQFLSQSKIVTKYASCPDVVAAYLEVVNNVWELQLADGLTLEPTISMLLNSPSLALLKGQKAINDLFVAQQSNQAISSLRTILLDSQTGVNTLVTALETTPKLWNPATATHETLLELCRLYIDVALSTTYLEAQIAAVENLVNVLDVLLRNETHETLPIDELASLWACIPLGPMNPELSNAIIRAGGGIIAALHIAGMITAEGLNRWAILMADAGLDDKVRTYTITSSTKTRKRSLY